MIIQLKLEQDCVALNIGCMNMNFEWPIQV